MATLITDPALEGRLQAERADSGADRYDEVWEGTCVMAPMPNIEHQDLVNHFAAVFQEIIGWPGLGMVLPGCNVSDRKEDWQQNYRVPDVAVVLRDGRAQNLDTHWYGGPDFVVEVLSSNEKSQAKLKFYADVRVGEVLLVDRDPWNLELYRLRGEELYLVGNSEPGGSDLLRSEVLPFAFRLVPDEPRPKVEVRHHDSERLWLV